jgi:amicoumacin kinase
MEISNETPQAGAARFGVDTVTLRPLGGMDGVVYTCERDGTPYVLKFTPTPADKLPTLRAKLDFVRYMGDHGVSVARPIPSAAGEWIELLNPDAHSQAGTLYAVTLSERAPGEQVFQTNLWGERLFEEWGRVIGQMHRLTRDYGEARAWPGGLIGTWEDEHRSFAEWCPDDDARAKWQALGECLRALPVDRDSFGLIHNDPHPYNFMVCAAADGAPRITLFDFDVCNYHFFVTDIGIAVYHALFAPRQAGESDDAFARRFVDCFRRGYGRENQLSDAWWARLPLFVKYRQILLYVVMSGDI